MARQRAAHAEAVRRDAAQRWREAARLNRSAGRRLAFEAVAARLTFNRHKADWLRARSADHHARADQEFAQEKAILDDTAAGVVEVGGQDWYALNTDPGVVAAGPVYTGSRSALTGTDHPPSIDRTRSYQQRYGLRLPLAQHQVDLERAVPVDAQGNPMRTVDPRHPYFGLINDGGPSADPTRGINCQDCTLSFFETYVHGRPRVSAPRTFDAYAGGEPRHANGAEQIGVERAEHATGGRYQALCQTDRLPPHVAKQHVDQALSKIYWQLQAGGHGSFAFIVNSWEGGSAHAWAAVNQGGQILFVDPQSARVSDVPLYGHSGFPNPGQNIAAMDALVVDGQGRPMEFAGHPAGTWHPSTRTLPPMPPDPDRTATSPLLAPPAPPVRQESQPAVETTAPHSPSLDLPAPPRSTGTVYQSAFSATDPDPSTNLPPVPHPPRRTDPAPVLDSSPVTPTTVTPDADHPGVPQEPVIATDEAFPSDLTVSTAEPAPSPEPAPLPEPTLAALEPAASIRAPETELSASRPIVETSLPAPVTTTPSAEPADRIATALNFGPPRAARPSITYDPQEDVRRGYFNYANATRRNIGTDRRDSDAAELRSKADQFDEQAAQLRSEAAAAERDGFTERADRARRQSAELRTDADDARRAAERVLSGEQAPVRTEVNGREWSAVNEDVGQLARGGVETDDRSALTGNDHPPPIDRSRRYDERGGLRPPLALHQLELEQAMPRDADGRVLRLADPRVGNWFGLGNDGGPSADPTRGINCVDAALSLFDTYVHGRPRVAAPRTFDSYGNGDPDRPLGAELGGLRRIRETTGGRLQELCPNLGRSDPSTAQQAVEQAMSTLQNHLLNSGDGAFAFLVTDAQGGTAHAWVAVNHQGTILFLDNQTGKLSADTPLYSHDGTRNAANVVAVDVLVVDGDGRPAPLPDLEPTQRREEPVPDLPTEHEPDRPNLDPDRPWRQEDRQPSVDELIPASDAEAAARNTEIRNEIQELFRGQQFSDFHVRLAASDPVSVSPNSLVVRLDVLDHGGRRVGGTVRELRREADGTLTVDHHSLHLEPHAQGRGFARSFNGFLKGWYEYSGVKSIGVRATKTGGYAWARDGFDWAPDNHHRSREVIARLGDGIRRIDDHAAQLAAWRRGELDLDVDPLLQRYGVSRPDELDDRLRLERDAAQNIVDRAHDAPFGSKNHPSPDEISRAGSAGREGRNATWIGKEALLGSEWRGIKTLTDGVVRHPHAAPAEPAGLRAEPTGATPPQPPHEPPSTDIDPVQREQELLASLPLDDRSTLRAAIVEAEGVASACSRDLHLTISSVRWDSSEPPVLVGENHRVKTAHSLARAFIEENAVTSLSLTDFLARAKDRVRFSVQVEAAHYGAVVNTFLAELTNRGYTVRRTVSFWGPQGRHNGLNVALTNPDGFMIEIQFPTALSLAAGKLTHREYELLRLTATPWDIKTESVLRMLATTKRLNIDADQPQDLDSIHIDKFVDTTLAGWLAQDPRAVRALREYLGPDIRTMASRLAELGLELSDIPPFIIRGET